jgi:hypothetical protein
VLWRGSAELCVRTRPHPTPTPPPKRTHHDPRALDSRLLFRCGTHALLALQFLFYFLFFPSPTTRTLVPLPLLNVSFLPSTYACSLPQRMNCSDHAWVVEEKRGVMEGGGPKL